MAVVESPTGNRVAPRGHAVTSQRDSVFMVAGEASGDWVGARLAGALRRRRPEITLSGIGGRRMSGAGVELLADSAEWAAIGIFEALSRIPSVARALRAAHALLAAQRPSALVLIDAGAVNMRLVRMTRGLGLPTLYYFPPGSWRRTPRSVAVRDAVDAIATPFPWSADLLSGGRAYVKWVGHPVVESARPTLPLDVAAARYGVDRNRAVVAVAPGSRRQEIHYLLPTLVEAAQLLGSAALGVQFLIPVAASLRPEPIEQLVARAGVKAIFLDGMDYDALQLADLAIVCSGSVTLEFACLGIPMIVAYRASRATTLQFRLVRGLIGGQRFAAMPNIIAGREIIPELLGSAAQPGSIADAAAALLRDERRRAQMRADLHAVASALGPPGASERTAEMVLELIDAKGGRNASI